MFLLMAKSHQRVSFSHVCNSIHW